MRTHKDLDAWKGSVELAFELYRLTGKFPKAELYGLCSQIRRASVSVAANISEGAARKHTKEFIQFLRIALGSLSELETLLLISEGIGLITTTEQEQLQGKLNLLSAQLSGLIRSLEAKLRKSP
jgi:four helix bundle protein